MKNKTNIFKISCLGLLLFLAFSQASAQIGINTATPDSSSMMDLTSTTQGLLVPRMSSSDRRAIQNPADGLLVYDEDQSMYFYYSTIESNWLGLSAWDFKDVRTDYDGVYYQRDLNISKDVTSVSIGTSNPVAGNDLTVVNNVSIGDTVSTVSDNGLRVAGQVELNDNLSVSDTAKAVYLEAYGTVPLGGIIMWSGSVANIPDGFSICDGNSGAPINGITIPNLEDRFMVGYDASAASTPTNDSAKQTNYGNVGNTGGENNHQLSELELASHNHGGFTSDAGLHTHEFDDTYLAQDEQVGGAKSGSEGVGSLGSNEDVTNSGGEHDHTITAEGGNASHENRPAYYVLAFIIRTK